MRILTLFVMMFLVSFQVMGSESGLEYSEGNRLSYASFGVGGVSLSSTAKIRSIAFTAQYRKLLNQIPLGFVGQVNPIFQKSGIFGIHAGVGVSYLVLGASQRDWSVREGQDLIVSQRSSRSPFLLFFDASLALLPVFGGSATTTLTGYNLALQGYFSSFPVQVTLQYSPLTLGSRSSSLVSGFLSYYWSI
jgi:hypothetical protein